MKSQGPADRIVRALCNERRNSDIRADDPELSRRLSEEMLRLQRNSYPHMCRDEHEQIGHSDSEHEMCPLCRANAEIASLKLETEDAHARADEANREWRERQREIERALAKLRKAAEPFVALLERMPSTGYALVPVKTEDVRALAALSEPAKEKNADRS